MIQKVGSSGLCSEGVLQHQGKFSSCPQLPGEGTAGLAGMRERFDVAGSLRQAESANHLLTNSLGCTEFSA